MTHLQVYDPPMCCSTGVCGPQVDPELPRFAADLHWLQKQGLVVERYNLAQQPQTFVQNAVVKQTLVAEGEKCLPLVLVDGEIVSRGSYPARDELAALAGVDFLAEEYLAAEREVQLLKIAPCCVPGPDGAVQKC